MQQLDIDAFVKAHLVEALRAGGITLAPSRRVVSVTRLAGCAGGAGAAIGGSGSAVDCGGGTGMGCTAGGCGAGAGCMGSGMRMGGGM